MMAEQETHLKHLKPKAVFSRLGILIENPSLSKTREQPLS
jgi:hypothetical protein